MNKIGPAVPKIWPSEQYFVATKNTSFFFGYRIYLLLLEQYVKSLQNPSHFSTYVNILRTSYRDGTRN